MNRIEYQRKQEEIIENNYKIRSLLDKEFADSNNKIKIGDIIEDKYTKIKVESMEYGQYFFGYLQFLYAGIKLHNKSNKPYNKKDTYKIWQQNIISINGQPYDYQEEIK